MNESGREQAMPPPERAQTSDGRVPAITSRDELQVLSGRRLEEARAIMSKYPNPRSAVLPLLFLVQAEEGYVTERGMREVAFLLGLTPAQVLAAGSFYTMLRKRPQGDYLLSVCRNVACRHNGAQEVIEAACRRLGIEVGQTTPDGRFEIETAECLATCDGAPSMQVNYEDFYNMTPEGVVELIDRLERGEEVRSVRGEPVKTSREISYETALSGARLPGTAGDHAARTVGGEFPRPDTAPGRRPKLDAEREEGMGG